jgi:hypothetical protein
MRVRCIVMLSDCEGGVGWLVGWWWWCTWLVHSFMGAGLWKMDG